MTIDFLLERFAANRVRPAIVGRDRAYDYSWLLEQRLAGTRFKIMRSQPEAQASSAR